MNTERILHVALRTPDEKQPALERALRSIAAEYAEVDWMPAPDHAARAIGRVASVIRPTLVFMQLQRAGVLSQTDIVALRSVCDPSVVIVNWDGDQHHEPSSPERAWFVELGRVCDASLVVNTAHPSAYAALGVKNPGYLQIGVDATLYRPTEPTPGTPPVVMLASRYQTHAMRNDVVERLAQRYGARFGVYGHGWSGECARPFLRQDQEAGVYAGAQVAISMSIRNDLPCYTSDRLFRAMGSGALVAVERFPGMERLGLLPDWDCFAWEGGDALCTIIDGVLEATQQQFDGMRRNATGLVHARHTWQARMPELLQTVEAARAAR